MKKKFVIIFVIIFAVIFAVVLLLGAAFQVYRYLNPLEPEAGVWQNDELHMTMEFGPNGNSAVITENGNTVFCDLARKPNSSAYTVYEAEELDNGHILVGNRLFAFTCKKATEDTLVMKDKDSGKKYVFYRVLEDD